MKRREFLQLAGSTAAASTTPAMFGLFGLGDAEAFTQAAIDGTEEIAKFRDGYPSFVLKYEDEERRDSLISWLEDTETAKVHRKLDSFNMISASMSWDDAGRTSTFGFQRYGGGLNDLDYLEYASPNAMMQRPEPILSHNLATPDDVEVDLRIRDHVSMMTSLGTRDVSPATTGLAFDEDAPEATLREARQLVNAGDSVVDSVDTSSTTVVVIDTGAKDRSVFEDSTGTFRFHPRSTNFTEAGDPTVESDGVDAIYDGDDHGSWVGGCIVSDSDDPAYRGFAPDAELLVAKSLGDDGGGAVADIVAGVELAIDVGADVACMSLGSPQWSESLAEALTKAWEEGIFTAVATGNDRYGTTFVATPASVENAFGVNATNVPESGNIEDTKIAYFGNVGPAPGTQDFSSGESEGAMPKLAAPGMNVRIEPFGALTGTSMAAPMITGGAALLSADGHGNEAILERLTTCYQPFPNAGVTEAEYGLLDVKAALNGNETEETQEDVLSDEAKARDEFNRALADTRGRTFAGFL